MVERLGRLDPGNVARPGLAPVPRPGAAGEELGVLVQSWPRRWRRPRGCDGFRLWGPINSMLLVSVVLSVLLWVVRRLL